MQKVYVGKVVGTHGIKGEIRIISDFQFKDKVFVVGNSLVINDKDYVIRSYRKHKNFDMVTLNDYNDINEVLFLVRNKVYFDKEKLNLSNEEVLDEDLLEFKVIDKDGRVGKVAALTIGGKALGKGFAINKSDIILYQFAKTVSHFYKGK